MTNQSQATNATIALKPVRDLLGQAGQSARYWIPSYQRGYRWTPLQVTQLLDDIWAFIEASENGPRTQFYCLQPLVVKVLPDGRFEVVDGQQRLTTLYIILTCLKDIAKLLAGPFFQITFETRDEPNRPSLDPIDLSRDMENADYYHVCRAYRAVQDWCREHHQLHQLKFLQHLLNDDATGRNVKVIWFELGANDNAVDAFTRLNVGKIRLTNDELIRALFLGGGRDGRSQDDALKVQIAYEWDLIEKELQAADFWAFLTDDKREQNRIGYLFELIAKADGIPTEAEHDEYRVFYSFSKKLGESTLEREWLKIKQEFMRLQEWFEDEHRISYHIIGFLVTQSVDMAEIRELSKKCTKSAFHRRLRDRAYQCITGKRVVPPEPELRADIDAYLDAMEYSDKMKEKIRATLLLFNIASLLEHGRSNLRFHFDAFKDSSFGWDLEHIRSVAPDRIIDRAVWLEDCKLFFKAQPDDASQSLVKVIDAHLAPGANPSKEQFGPLRKLILDHLQESASDEERNDLSNLTLLDSRTNRSYKNAPFAVKRQKILSLDKAGVFVPLCTRNVFLKAYSAQMGNAIIWSNDDADAYERAISETLVGFFLGKEAAQ